MAHIHDIHPIVYNGPDEDYTGDEIVVCFNGYNGIAIVNAEDKDDIQLISQLTYAQSGYTHQGWVGENQRFCYFNDELDESNFGNNTRTYIMDVKTSMPQRSSGISRLLSNPWTTTCTSSGTRCTNRITSAACACWT